MSGERRVCIVTPFYNTADYLSECIESVLAQTYENFEYILVDNCSDDGSAEIAEAYVKQDSRIRFYSNAEHLNQVENYNSAIGKMGRDCVYCKIVQADDWIFPECIERMVQAGERCPEAGIIGAYGLYGNRVYPQGLRWEEQCLSGHAIVERFWKDELYLFGTPTSIMFRSDFVRSETRFFDEEHPIEDADACFRILEQSAFAFVHQVLTFTRRDNTSIVTRINTYNPLLLLRFLSIRQYGALFLEEAELASVSKAITKEYLRYLGQSLIRGRDAEFWRFHKRCMDFVGYVPEKRTLWKNAVLSGMGYLANPDQIVRKLLGN